MNSVAITPSNIEERRQQYRRQEEENGSGCSVPAQMRAAVRGDSAPILATRRGLPVALVTQTEGRRVPPPVLLSPF